MPALAATSSPETAHAAASAQVQASGGWTVNAKTGTYVTKAQKLLFKKATAKLVGVTYTPVFVMSKQLVAGMNYAYFCKAETATAKKGVSWKVVIVYKPIAGKASVLAVNNFNYKKIKTLKNAQGVEGLRRVGQHREEAQVQGAAQGGAHCLQEGGQELCRGGADSSRAALLPGGRGHELPLPVQRRRAGVQGRELLRG